MTPATIAILACLFFAAAALYSTVGHAGASAYLAAMVLLGVEQAVRSPTAFSLNILVASLTTYRFYRAGFFSWDTFWPFALGSVPWTFVGATMTLPGPYYNYLLAAVLLFAAFWLLVSKPVGTDHLRKPSWAVAVLCGAAIGVICGLTGTGGGIFLSPLLLFMGWADTKTAAGVSAAFILVNSISGLLGIFSKQGHLPQPILIWLGAVFVGGLLGSHWGSQRLGVFALRRVLAVVLVVAGGKLILGF